MNDASGTPRETVRRLEGRITTLRGELGELVADLDRRRQEALDVRLQVRRHAGEITLTSAALVGAAAGYVGLSVWRARRRQRLAARVGRVQPTLSRLIAGRAGVAAEPTIARRIARATANGAAVALIRMVLRRVVRRVLDRGRSAATDARARAKPQSPTAA